METTTDNNYTEEQALDLVAKLAKQFGWKYAMFTQDEIKEAWDRVTDYKPITPEQMTEVKNTRMWVKYLEESMITDGLEAIEETVYEIANEKGLVP